MAAITAALVKELRETTGAGMMDCKKALVETDGDMNKAIDYLREKGLSKAAKKSGRIAAEGLVRLAFTADGTKAAAIEVNSESDFVAKNPEFIEFVEKLADITLNLEDGSCENCLKKAAATGDRASSASALVMRGDVIVANGADSPESYRQALTDSYLRVALMYTDEPCREARATAMRKAATCFDKLGMAARAEAMRTQAGTL